MSNPHETQQTWKLMRASVVIPTYNRPQLLNRLLASLAEQEGDSLLEVLVCDDGSTSSTLEATLAWKDRVPGLRHLWQEDLGFRAGQARNMGIQAAQGDVIIFVDDDVLVAPDFVERHVAAHQSSQAPRVVLGFRHHANVPPKHACPTVEEMLAGGPDDRIEPLGLHGERMVESPHKWFYVYSCNVSVPRRSEIWFDDDFVGWGMEDLELGYRLEKKGFEILLEPLARVLHIEDPTPRDPFRCVDRGIAPQYDTYVRNMVLFIHKYPSDQALRNLLANDLRWYVRDAADEHWVKNGHENSANAVIATIQAELSPPNEADSPTLIRPKEFVSPDPKSSPLSWPMTEIAIELTTYCNLSCTMCSVWMGKESGPDSATVRQILADARELGATSFVPCGAENFMRKDFVDLLEYATELGYETLEVVTNGILIPKHIERLEKLPGLSLHVSIDGPPEVHDALRGEGAYAKAMDAVALVVERKISVGLSGVLMRPTLDTAHHIIDKAVELGLTEVSYQPFQPEIDGWRDSTPWMFPPTDRRRVEEGIAHLRRYAGERGIRIYTDELLDYVPSYLFDGVRPIPPGGCYMPSRFLLVDVHGDVYPCFFMRNDVIGNVNKGERIADLWHNRTHTALQMLGITSRCPGCLAACSDVASFDAIPVRKRAIGESTAWTK